MDVRILPRIAAMLAALTALPAMADADIRFLNPEGLFKPSTFSQIAVTKGGRVIYISGQTTRDPTSKIVAAGDVKGQAEKVFANLRTAIESVGGSMRDVA